MPGGSDACQGWCWDHSQGSPQVVLLTVEVDVAGETGTNPGGRHTACGQDQNRRPNFLSSAPVQLPNTQLFLSMSALRPASLFHETVPLGAPT